MSKSIDNRVVSMQFDNKKFESNVSTTMSTLDKLKAKLQLKNASKGLENIDRAAKNVNMGTLGSAVETVRTKFSALEVMGVTALANITNSAVNAGKRIVSALAIGSIKTGFQEYETQINAVQTILANTESKGSTLVDVNRALEELNKYADMTIYNFTEMTRNIGTFTAAGVDLNTATNAIKGIANLAAVSGSTSQQASTAMYQLSQALSAGTVKLMDWNSVVNAGMGGQVFQDALKETARVHGIAIDSMIEEQGSFRNTLQEGWLTSEILTETLQKFTLATEGLTEEQIAANREMLKAKGYTDAQIESIFKLGNTATNAATKVKTFTQMWDVMKESAQSGWAQTWKIVIGDFEEARSLFTPLTDFFTGIINKMSEARNALLESALAKGFEKLKEKVDRLSSPLKTASKALTTVKDSVEDLGKIVDKVIYGSYGNGQARFEALTEAGYNYYKVQNKVNETLGNSYRYSQDKIEAQDKLLGVETQLVDANGEITDSTKEQLKALTKLNNVQLHHKGYTTDQIQTIRQLETEAEKLGLTTEEFIDHLDEINGRWILLNAFKNIGNVLVDVFKAMKTAWQEIFPPKSMDERAEGIYNIITAFHKFTQSIAIFDKDSGKLTETGDKIVRTFKGVFAALDIVLTIVKGPIKIAFEIFKSVLELLDKDVLDLTAGLGDAIVNFRDWLKGLIDSSGIFTKIAEAIVAPLKGIKEWWNTVKDAENVPKAIFESLGRGIQSIFTSIGDFFRQLGEYIRNGSGELPGFMASGFLNGIWSAIKSVGQGIIEFGKSIIQKLKDILGIHSPSTVTHEMGEDFVQGFANGVSGFGEKLKAFFKTLFAGIKDGIKNFDVSVIASLLRNIALWVPNGFLKNVLNTVANIASSMGTELVDKLKETLGIHSPAKSTWEIARDLILGAVKGIKDFASLLWDAVSTVFMNALDFIKKLDFGTVIAGVLSFGLIKTIGELAKALDTLGQPLKGLGSMLTDIGKAEIMKAKANQMEARAKVIKSLALAIGVLAAAMYVLGNMEKEELIKASAALGTLVVAVILLAAAAKMIGGAGGANANVLTIVGVTVSLMLLAMALKKVASVPAEDLERSIEAILMMLAGIALILYALTKVSGSGFGKGVGKIGTMLIGMSIAMLLMVSIIKKIDKLDDSAITRGLAVITHMMGLFAAIVLVSKFAGQYGSKAGSMLIKMSVALLIMVFVMKQVDKLDEEAIKKGVKFMTIMGVFVTALVFISKYAGANAGKAGTMLLLVSGALLIMTYVIKQVSELDGEALIKGITVIGILSSFMAALMFVSKFAGKSGVQIGAMLMSIATSLLIMSGVLAILSILPKEGLTRALAIVTVLELLIAGLIYVTKDAKDCKQTLTVLAVIIVLLIGALIGLSFIDKSQLANAATALSAVIGVFTLLVLSLQFLKSGEKTYKRNITTLLTLAAVVAILGGLIVAIASVDNPDAVLPIAEGLALVLVALAGALAILSNTKTMSKQKLQRTAQMLGVMTGIMVLLSGILMLMSACDTQNAIPNAIGLSILAATMTGLMLILSVASKGTKSALKGILALTAMAVPLLAFALAISVIPDITGVAKSVMVLVAVMTAMTLLLIPLALIGLLGWGPFIGILALTAMVVPLVAFAFAISVLPDITACQPSLKVLITVMYLLTALMVPLTIIGLLAWATIPGILALTTMVVPLIAFAVAISKIPDITACQANIAVLTAVMYSLTSLMVPLTLIGILAIAALAGISALTAMVVPLVAFGLALHLLPDVTGAIGNVMLLTGLMDALTEILLKIAPVAILATIGVVALTALSGLMLAMGGFALAVGAFMETIPGLQQFLDTGIEVMIQLADGLGRMIGAFVTGIATAIISLLPGLGEALGIFWVNASMFISGVKMLDASFIAQVGFLTAAIAALSVASFMEGIAGLMGCGLADLGQELSNFIMSALPFLMTLATINPSIMDSAKALAETVMIFTGASLLDGLTKFIGGGSSFAEFGEQLAAFGPGLAAFANSVSGLSEAQLNAMKISAESGKLLAEMAKTFPNSGGWLGKILGENDADTFGEQLEGFGKSLMAYGQVVYGIEKYVDSINASAEVGGALSELADGLPNSGGWIAAVLGDNTIDEFGLQLEGFGKSIMAYGAAVSGIGQYIESIKASAEVGGALSELADSLPNSGGWIAAVLGDNTIDEFGEQLKGFGAGIMAYGKAVHNISDYTESINNSTSIVDKMIEIFNTIKKKLKMDWGENEIDKLGNGLNNLGTGMSKFTKAINGIGDTDKAKSIVDKVIGIVNSIKTKLMWDLGKSEISKLSTDLQTLSQSITDFYDSMAKTNEVTLKDAGCEAIKFFVNGIKDCGSKIVDAFNEGITRAVTVLKSSATYYKFYEVGNWLVEGMAYGIDMNDYKVEAKARVMARRAVDAAKEELDINSPSKVFRAIGYSVPEGFAMGIDKLSGLVAQSSSDMAHTAIRGVSDSIAKLSDIVSSDIDTQPTIRPVLDLSDVRSGANAIGSMFSGRTLALDTGNIGSVSAMMENYQNGSNSGDIVSAIKALRKDMADMPRNNYNVGGITYDDGSNVATAVKELIRAARIEGRV